MYFSSGGVFRAPTRAGAEWVCVAAMKIRSVGIPVTLQVNSFARSITGRGTTQLSICTMAICPAPSSSTRHRACRGSSAFLA